MRAHYLGHVVFYVKDLQRSLAFYRDLLGFQEVGRISNGAAAALTSGRTHHEILLIQVGDVPDHRPGGAEGSITLGLRLATAWRNYAQQKENWSRPVVMIEGMSDHTVSQSLYLRGA